MKIFPYHCVQTYEELSKMFMSAQEYKKGIFAMVKWPNLRRFIAKFTQLMAYFYFLWALQGIFSSMNQQKLYLLLVPTGYGGVASMIF